MNHCKIVEDLMPLYLDGLTNPETADYVREHLEGCPACAALCQRGRAEELKKELEEPDYKQPLQESILKIVLKTVLASVLAAALFVYVLWEMGLVFAPSKTMESNDGSFFKVTYYSDAGFFSKCGAWVQTPDGKGRDYRGREDFVDVNVYWAPNGDYYFYHCDLTGQDESFYWGYDAPPTPVYDDEGNVTGTRSRYSDRKYPQDEDLFGYMQTLCAEAGVDVERFSFERWSDGSDAMYFTYVTTEGAAGMVRYSILTNTLSFE